VVIILAIVLWCRRGRTVGAGSQSCLQRWKLTCWRQKQHQQFREVELELEVLGVDLGGHKSGPVQRYKEIIYFNMKMNPFRM
jgi:hypothetical protein